MTNKKFAETDQEFQKACEAVKLPFDAVHGKKKNSLARQAGKWRRQTGLAYKEGRS